MAVAIPMGSICADASARVGGDALGRFFDRQGLKLSRSSMIMIT
ncbi:MULTISPECIES: hypothetical protein [unclassified Prochlorococcus]|nr:MULTISPECIES: hypothetical protein [unclassified Prochlorococcus]KGG27660.1 hypothetical protein EV13_2064 [Prochlorococcus sp. MIT 0702]KGG28223.1 hypothetical protein EV12_0973 [Prochlorococcus sp. MIT 0701]KGG37274.1 hypothetical protein EV14_0066 [Prochlorococcus sp. MIT 0703]